VVALPSVNLLAVIAAAAVVFVLGGAYWAVVAPAFSRRLGRPTDDVRPTPAQLSIAFVTRVVVAYFLAVFAGWAAVTGIGGGAEVGFLAWLGLVVPYIIGQASFERKPWQTVALALPEALTAYVVMGAIVGAWR
jgi:Protein of unknown function (DUF1761)